MLSPMNVQDAKREEGFTLIELLVVVIIIGILAAIAIPVFLNQRERAWQSSVESDLRNAAVAQETYLTDNATYTTNVADLEGLGFSSTEGVSAVAITLSEEGQAYCLYAEWTARETIRAAYNSADGGINRGGTCTAPAE
jgi:type IV pilus assembly protein PilA